MKLQRHLHLLGGAIVVAGCAIMLTGCLGFGGGSSDATSSTLQHARVATTATSTESVADASGQPIVVSPADKYSSFQSKDPFVQQQQPTTTETPTSSATTTPASTTTTTTTTTTTSTSTSSTSTTSTSTTSTSSPTTSTTSFFTHMLQVLVVGNDAGGTPAVTFQVDNNVYMDQHAKDVVSTSWGDVTVAGIDIDAHTVTLLHQGKTLTMAPPDFVFE